MSLAGINFSYFASVIGVTGTTFSLAMLSRLYLPNVLIKQLDDLLQETHKLYDESVTEELLHGHLKADYSQRLLFLETLEREQREEAYRALGIFRQYVALVSGLSIRILRTCNDAARLRSRVLTTSTEEMRRRHGGTEDNTCFSDTASLPQSIIHEEGFLHVRNSPASSASNGRELRDNCRGSIFQAISFPWLRTYMSAKDSCDIEANLSNTDSPAIESQNATLSHVPPNIPSKPASVYLAK